MNKDFGVAYLRNDDTGVKVTLSEFRGRLYIHIREYIFDIEEEVWFPTKKGYALDAEKVDSVIELLSMASQEIAKTYRPNYQLELDLRSKDE